MKLLPRRYMIFLTAIFIALELGAVALSYSLADGFIRDMIRHDVSLAMSVAAYPDDASKWSIISGENNAVSDDNILARYGYSTTMRPREHELFPGTFSAICIALCLSVLAAYAAFLACLHKFSRIIDRRINHLGDLVEQDMAPEANYGESALDYLALALREQCSRHISGGERARNDRKYMKDLLADMSHQLKTPIASMRMYVELMQRAPDMDADMRAQLLSGSMQQIERTEWLVQGLLKMARLEAGAVRLNMRPACIDETLELAAAPFKLSAQQSQASLTISGCGAIFAHDIDWLAEAIGNLIKNALEHAPGGHINVLATQTPLTVEICVSDDGEGIALDVLPHLFERFYSHSSDVKAGSVGLGLALAKEIITQSGGTISVESQLGHGTTFNIVFLTNK